MSSSNSGVTLFGRISNSLGDIKGIQGCYNCWIYWICWKKGHFSVFLGKAGKQYPFLTIRCWKTGFSPIFSVYISRLLITVLCIFILPNPANPPAVVTTLLLFSKIFACGAIYLYIIWYQGGERPLEPLETPGKTLQDPRPWKKPWKPPEKKSSTLGRNEISLETPGNLNFVNYVVYGLLLLTFK